MADALFRSSNEELLRNLECPVCFSIIYPPITECPNGHLICSDCKPKLENTCPICKTTLGDTRAFALERFASHIPFPCLYRSNGCNEIVQYEAKEQHEKECRYSHRPYNCPYPCSRCEFTGDIPKLVSHLQEIHESIIEDSFVIDTLCFRTEPYDERDVSSNIEVYSMDNHYFCLHFESFYGPHGLVHMVFLTFMGEDFEARNYRCRLEIGIDPSKLAWEGIPRSIRENIQDIKESYYGLIIDGSVAQNFSEENSLEELILPVKGMIWTESEGDGLFNVPY